MLHVPGGIVFPLLTLLLLHSAFNVAILERFVAHEARHVFLERVAELAVRLPHVCVDFVIRRALVLEAVLIEVDANFSAHHSPNVQ